MANSASSQGSPAHHRPGGGFQRPWPVDPLPGENGSFLRWQRERRQTPPPPTPGRDAFNLCAPDPRRPRADSDTLTLTWIGHSTFLIQLGGLNVLTDPHFSDRASPVQWAGPTRMASLPMDIDELPPIDAVVLSHDHYDHLDTTSVRRLARHSPDATWLSPLGYEPWLRRRRVEVVNELDWWDASSVNGLRFTCVPVQHWTRRGFRSNERLWAGWAMEVDSVSGHGRSVLFAGDSGYFPGFKDIGARLGPFDANLLPIGAYEPRWFMRTSHMNPEEAVDVYRDLGDQGLFVGMHWGTFRLTDEDPLEPPIRTRAAWQQRGLDPARLWVPQHGETRVVAQTEP